MRNAKHFRVAKGSDFSESGDEIGNYVSQKRLMDRPQLWGAVW